MAKKIWTIVFLFPLFLYGQTVRLRSEYIESYPNKFQVAPFIEAKSHVLDLNIDANSGLQRLTYISNFIYTSGVRLKYKQVVFAIGKKLPIHPFESRFGSSNNFGLGFSFVRPKFLVYSRYESYKGFYLSNTEDWFPGYEQQNGSLYQRPDLRTVTWFTGANYFFNHQRYSNLAALFDLERQKKAALGFVVGANFALNRIESDSVLTPLRARAMVTDSLSTYLNTFTLGLQGGLAFTIPLFAKKHFYLTSSLIPGYSLQWGESHNELVNTSKGNFFNGFTNEFRLGFGYNASKWFTGVVFNSFGNSINLSSDGRFIVQNAYLRLSAGMRFGN